MEVWVEFQGGKWRVSPDPAKVPRGTQLLWRFRGDGIDASRVRWTVYFDSGHPFALGNGRGAISAARLAISTETFRLFEGQHVGVSPVITADVAGDYKYGVRLENVDQDQEIGDDDPRLIVS